MVENEDAKCKIDLRSIKSSYIKKHIFSFLNEEQNMKMAVYNKELQKLCLVVIEDYKKKSGKYKILSLQLMRLILIIKHNLFIK